MKAIKLPPYCIPYLLGGLLLLSSCGLNTHQKSVVHHRKSARHMNLDNRYDLDTVFTLSPENKYYLQNQITEISRKTNEEAPDWLASDVKALEQITQQQSKPIPAARDSVFQSIFDISKCPCAFSDKLKGSVKKLKFYPEELNRYVEKMPGKVYYVKDESIASMLHRYTVKTANGPEEEILMGVPTYNNFNMTKFILTSSKSSFVYTLDCSGYLNAAISASNGRIADLEASARYAITSDKNILVAGGTCVSPIAAAYYNNFELEQKMDTLLRLQILEPLLEMGYEDSDTIVVSASKQLVWFTNTGTGKSNGLIEMDVVAKLGLGPASFSSSLGARSEFTRTTSYTNFTVLYTNQFYLKRKPFTVGDLRALVKRLKGT